MSYVVFSQKVDYTNYFNLQTYNYNFNATNNDDSQAANVRIRLGWAHYKSLLY